MKTGNLSNDRAKMSSDTQLCRNPRRLLLKTYQHSSNWLNPSSNLRARLGVREPGETEEMQIVARGRVRGQ